MSSSTIDTKPISDTDISTNSSTGNLTKKPSFASIAAKGTSITVSELKAEVSMQQTNNDTLDLSNVFRNTLDDKSPTPAAASAAVLKPSPTQKSQNRRSISSSATVSTDNSSTASGASIPPSANDVPPVKNVPKPAPVQPKNPWKTQTNLLSESMSLSGSSALSSASDHEPTPAESKGMKAKPKQYPSQQTNINKVTSTTDDQTQDKELSADDKKSDKSSVAAPSTNTGKKNQGGSAWKSIEKGGSKNTTPNPLLKEIDGNNNSETTETKDTATAMSQETEKNNQNSVKPDPTSTDETTISTSKASTPTKKHTKNVHKNISNNNKSRNNGNKKNQRSKGGNANNATNNSSNSPNSKKKNSHHNSNAIGTNNSGNSPKKNKHKKQTKKKNKNKKTNSKNKKGFTLTPQDLENLTRGAVGQVEYFFSADELVKNIFIRQRMDVEGYLPAAIVFNFPSILSYGIPYYELLNAIAEMSNVVEVDLVNECLRVKGDEEEYKRWLFCNADGTYGCPKWIKEQEEVVVATPEQKGEINQKPELTMTDSDTDCSQ